MNQVTEYANEDIALPAILEPTTFQQAKKDDNSERWQQAMQQELNELQNQKTWELVQLPPNRKALKGRWVYKVKYPPDKPPIYKARWVAKGFQQRPGVDFGETFANTANPTTYRLLLAIATKMDWEIEQWDVKSAYPNATLHDEVYIQQPTGFEDSKRSELVCRCLKALYGLKQAAREWQLFLRDLLGKQGLIPLKIDQGVFIHTDEILIVITYVDDLIVITDKLDTAKRLYRNLETAITISNLGPVNEFLGIEITRDRSKRSLSLSQTKYTKKLLQRFGYSPNDIVKPLIPITNKIAPNTEETKPETIRDYQQQIGSIMYLMTKTRPDLAYSIGLCARFMANPSPEHFKALEKIWKYLTHT